MGDLKMIVRFIIEVMGKPQEVVEKTLHKVVDTVKERFEVLVEDYSDAELVGESDIYSAFVEFEFKPESFEDLFAAVIDFGPTVVEVIEPSEFSVSNTELQGVITDLVAKFHNMSKAIQLLKVENSKLKKVSETTL